MDMRRRGVAFAAGLLVAGSLLTGCAEAGPGEAGGSTTTPGGIVTTSGGSPSPTGSPTGGPPRPPTEPLPTTGDPVGQMTLRGVIVEGVEANCKAFKTDSGMGYELFGVKDAALLRPGTRLEVTGSLATDLVSHCMQGDILRVTSARRI
jgi:hypothetical protein